MQPFPKLWATPQMGHKTPSKTWTSLPKPEGAEPNHYFYLPHFIRPSYCVLTFALLHYQLFKFLCCMGVAGAGRGERIFIQYKG